MSTTMMTSYSIRSGSILSFSAIPLLLGHRLLVERSYTYSYNKLCPPEILHTGLVDICTGT